MIDEVYRLAEEIKQFNERKRIDLVKINTSLSKLTLCIHYFKYIEVDDYDISDKYKYYRGRKTLKSNDENTIITTEIVGIDLNNEINGDNNSLIIFDL